MEDKHKELNILLQQFKDGDQKAFEEIYKRCSGHIAFVCSKLCDNKEDVEEAVQDTFMAAFKNVDTLRGDTLLALLRKIAARRCYDKRKKNQSEPLVYLDEPIEVVDLDEDFLPEEYLQNKESQTNLLRIINELPTKQREMIYLYYYADINTEEIASLNNCSGVNVRKILFNARNTIKSKLTSGMGMAGVAPITAVLLAEEAAFTAGYAGAAAGTTVATTGTATSATSYIAIAAGVIAIGAISIAAYFALSSPAQEVHEETTPPIAIISPILTNDIEEPTEEIIQQTIEITEEPIEEPAEEIIEEPIEEVYEPEYIQYTPEPIAAFEEEPTEMEEPEQTEEQPELEEPNEPEQEPEPPTVYVDRLSEILAALAAATTTEEAGDIINRYGFVRTDSIRSSDYEWFWFYVYVSGNGDILVGITQEHFRFGHYANEKRPTDMADLLDWMEG